MEVEHSNWDTQKTIQDATQWANMSMSACVWLRSQGFQRVEFQSTNFPIENRYSLQPDRVFHTPELKRYTRETCSQKNKVSESCKA